MIPYIRLHLNVHFKLGKSGSLPKRVKIFTKLLIPFVTLLIKYFQVYNFKKIKSDSFLQYVYKNDYL